jgi:putative AbiEii toxin of type IV toxin-antitoxin system/AAA domain-containing protein
MYVRRVVLENIRGFKKVDFKFERPGGGYPGWTVITGDNASGKTALLKSIALALVGPDSARALQPSLKGWLKKGTNEATIAVEIVAGDKDRFAKGRRYEQPFWSELKLTGHETSEVVLGLGNKYKGKGLGPTHGPWAESPEGWFCAGYGPFRRIYGVSPDAQRIMLGPGRVARFATMFREDATLGECEAWLKNLHHKELEGGQVETTILDQVLRLLNDDFLRNGLKVEKVDSEGLWLRDSTGITLPLADMSEGYRAALAMLVDITRHMIDVHGHDGFVAEQTGRLIVPHTGVVLIDEMDSHLHPEWQRRIGFWLKERFPNVQFIVTTHSAFICQAANEMGIFHLPPPGSDQEPFQIPEEQYWKIVKSKPDAIFLSPAFGMSYTRSPRAVAARRKYAELSAKKSSGGALSTLETEEIKQAELFVDAETNGEAGDA